MKRFISLINVIAFALTFSLISCSDDDGDSASSNPYGIPSDDLASDNPDIGTSTTTLPNLSYSVESYGDDAIVRIDMTGIQDMSDYTWLRLLGTAESGQNVWVSVDGKAKGISVYNSADDEEEDQVIAADLVFLVDNSGSMSQEADSVAAGIVNWANKLEESSLDIQFGLVGYSVSGSINGAINLTDAETLSEYLDYSSGTSRTIHFGGDDASTLSTAASAYRVSNECGGMALRYADSNISFRTGTNRVYVNFTDEPNQPAGNDDYSTEYFSDETNWSTTQGTVHTVYSADTTYTESMGYNEKPWRISWYTGGTVLVAPSDFSNVTLESLPVTGALQNSYIIRFTNVKEFMDGLDHLVKITVLSTDNLTRAEKTFYINFGSSDTAE